MWWGVRCNVSSKCVCVGCVCGVVIVGSVCRVVSVGGVEGTVSITGREASSVAAALCPPSGLPDLLVTHIFIHSVSFLTSAFKISFSFVSTIISLTICSCSESLTNCESCKSMRSDMECMVKCSGFTDGILLALFGKISMSKSDP